MTLSMALSRKSIDEKDVIMKFISYYLLNNYNYYNYFLY